MSFKRTYLIVAVTLSTLLSACGSDENNSDSEFKSNGLEQAKVFKSKGAIQCEGEGIPLNEMRLELAKAGIDVICAQEADDGYVRLTACGTETGDINVFVIHSSNIPDAQALGYKSVEELPDYTDQACVN